MSSTEQDSYVEGPRHAVVTPNDVGPIITIITLFLMVVMVLAVTLRLMLRLTTSHVPGVDDVVVSLALLMALGEVITTTLTVNDGLGTRLATLSAAQRVIVQKGLYASGLLYILTIALAKASTIFLLQRLTTSKVHKMVGRVIIVVLTTWTVAAVFGLGFQCPLPDAWAILSDKCFNIVAFWDVIGAFDIGLDVALVIMPMCIIWNLKMSARRKTIVVIGFGFRLVLCASQMIRLTYLHRYATNSNTLFSSLGFILATQFETMFAVVAACIPALKPFMDRIASGLMAVSFRDREGTYAMESFNKTPHSGSRSKQSSGNGGRGPNGTRSRSLPIPEFSSNGDYHAEIAASVANRGRSMPGEPGSAENTAQKTVEWEVRYSDEARLNEKSSWILDRTSEERDSLRQPRGSMQRPHNFFEHS